MMSLKRHGGRQSQRSRDLPKPVNPCHPPRSDSIGRARSLEPRIVIPEELVAAGVIDEYNRSAVIFVRSTLHGRVMKRRSGRFSFNEGDVVASDRSVPPVGPNVLAWTQTSSFLDLDNVER